MSKDGLFHAALSGHAPLSPDAACALDAACHDGLDQRPDVLVLHRPLVLCEATAVRAELHGLVLVGGGKGLGGWCVCVALGGLALTGLAVRGGVEDFDCPHRLAINTHSRVC